MFEVPAPQEKNLNPEETQTGTPQSLLQRPDMTRVSGLSNITKVSFPNDLSSSTVEGCVISFVGALCLISILNLKHRR